MDFPKIIFNGQIADFTSIFSGGDSLLGEFYLYQNLHILDGQALFLDQHSQLVSNQSKEFFDKEFCCDELESMISLLLKANYCNLGSYQLRLYIWRDSFMISVCKRLIYNGFTLWHTRMSANIIKCENTFTGISTSLSLMSTNYALSGSKNQVSLCVNVKGVITGVGDAPVFFMKNNMVFTSPLEQGVVASVAREQTIKAIQKIGFTLNQQPVKDKELEDFDEVFYVDTQGLVSVKDFQDKIFISVVAQRIAQEMFE